MSTRTTRLALAAGILAAGFGAATANADVIATLTYDDLGGSFTRNGAGTGGAFVARAVDLAGALQTSGATSRIIPTQGNADFAPGFVSAANPADAVINIGTLFTGPGTASGNGNFVATDIDGDTVTGDLSGEWTTPGAGILFFNGALTNVRMNGQTFNGNTGSWDMNLPGGPIFEGAIVQLTFSGSGFFDQNFTNRATGTTLQIVPAPGALALLGLGGLVAARRRTR